MSYVDALPPRENGELMADFLTGARALVWPDPAEGCS